MKNYNFCKYSSGKKYYDFDRCRDCNKTCPSVSNIFYGYILKLPIIEQIYDSYYRFIVKRENKEFEKNYISDDESTTAKLIFAISACDSWQGLFGANDFDVVYDKVKNKYSMGIETMFCFDSQEGSKKYLMSTLNQFTKFIIDNGYDVNYKLNINDVFTYGYNMNTLFDSVEECYATFKLLVEGF